MFQRKEPDALVVGAGPVGLFTAVRLARRSIATRVVDLEMRRAAHSYALALHPASLALLDESGIDPEKDEETLRIDTVAFYDGGKRVGEAHLRNLPGEFPYLVVLRQSRLEEVLERAARRAGAEVAWQHRMESFAPDEGRHTVDVSKLDKVTTGYPVAWSEWEIVKRLETRPRFLVGADGHRSRVRRRLGIDFETVGPTELFAVFEFESEAFPPHEMRVVLDLGTTSVFWPLPGGYCRWSFQLPVDPLGSGELRHKSHLAVQVESELFPHLTRHFLLRLLDKRAPWFEGPVGEIGWSVMARFERRLAKSFGRDRVWLAGDSGHLTGPAGIQSMNVGLREAVDVADGIASVLERGESATDTIRAYDEARRAEWRRLHGMDGGLVAESGGSSWLEENRERILPCLPGSGEDLEKLAAQIGLRWAPADVSAG